MGMFQKKVRVCNPIKKHLAFEQAFWIDTGALYSYVPEDWLEKIEAEPSGSRDLVLADGRTSRRLIGTLTLEVEGLEGAMGCPVIFAPPGSLFLLGATALECFGVAADPVNKQLKPILSVIGGFLASQTAPS